MPSKDDYLTQIDADLAAGTEPEEILNERRAAVEAAADDDAAAVAYAQSVTRIDDESLARARLAADEAEAESAAERQRAAEAMPDPEHDQAEAPAEDA